jgi:hypothetical protein
VATSAAARLTALARRLDTLDQVLVDVVGQAVLDKLDDQLHADTGDGALSGVGGGRYRLTVKVTPLSNPAGVRIRPAPKQAGMWTLISTGRSGGYTVAAKARRKRKARGKKAKTSSRGQAMAINGAWRAGPYHVKRGTRGRNTWVKGRDAGFTAGLAAARDELRKAVSGG